MNSRIRVRCAFLAAAAFLSGAASAAPNTPITSESVAARALVNAFQMRSQLRTLMTPFNREPRSMIDGALRSVSAVTTLQGLAAMPDGVVIGCAVSGTLTAKLGRGWPRVVRFEWDACVTEDFSSRYTLTGPGEVTLFGNSLSADTVASIRLGNRNTDLVRDIQPRVLSGLLGPRVETRNLRLTGIIPMGQVLDEITIAFDGRFAFEAVGFMRSDEMRRDVGPGGPGTEYFPWTFETSTEGALLSGENTFDDTSSLEEHQLVLGKLSQRIDRPATPTFPVARTTEAWVRGTGLRVRLGRGGSPWQEFWTIDGRLESSFAQAAGCAQPDTFTYRTRAPLLAHPETFFFNDWYDTGELAINGSTVANFSITGSQPFVDMRGQLALEVPGVGSFNYDTGSSVLATLGPLARCTSL